MDQYEERRITTARVLLIGAGPLCSAVTKHLLNNGLRRFVIADQTPGAADALAWELMGKGVSCSSYSGSLRSMDGWNFEVIVCCNADLDTRLFANLRAKQYTVCLVDGIVSGKRGRAQVVTSSGPCLQCVLSSRSAGVLEEPDPGTIEVLGGIMADMAVLIAKGRPLDCIPGVIYIEGPNSPIIVLDAGISPACPYHKINDWHNKWGEEDGN